MDKHLVYMDFQNHKLKLPVSNFDAVANNDQTLRRHGELLPSSIRAVFCGPSNCGKTNALLALLVHPNGLRFENVYIYSKTLNQPKYQFLKDLLEPIDEVQYFPFSDNQQVILPDQVLPNSIMIFDDIACEKQGNIKTYFYMGRHKDVDSFYLWQSYARIPKHFVIFRQDEMNLKHIYNDHVNTDMTFAQFKDLCLKCWNNDKFGFMAIDKDSDMGNGRYRKIFDQYLINTSAN